MKKNNFKLFIIALVICVILGGKIITNHQGVGNLPGVNSAPPGIGSRINSIHQG